MKVIIYEELLLIIIVIPEKIKNLSQRVTFFATEVFRHRVHAFWHICEPTCRNFLPNVD